MFLSSVVDAATAAAAAAAAASPLSAGEQARVGDRTHRRLGVVEGVVSLHTRSVSQHKSGEWHRAVHDISRLPLSALIMANDKRLMIRYGWYCCSGNGISFFFFDADPRGSFFLCVPSEGSISYPMFFRLAKCKHGRTPPPPNRW